MSEQNISLEMDQTPGFPNPIYLSFIVACTLLWLQISPFDLDEALFVGIAESIKASGNIWDLSFGGTPIYHKPPVFYWLMSLSSFIFDGDEARISAFAARFPSAVATCVLLMILSRTRERAVDFFSLMIFPMLLGASILFDPILSLFFLVWMNFKNAVTERSWWKEAILLSLPLSAAVAWKGLIGIVIPIGAVGLELCVLRFYRPSWRSVFTGIVPVLFGFTLTILFSTGIYGVYGAYLGRAFLDEFFWVHHFGRATAVMEAHGGGWSYYLIALILTAFPASLFLFSKDFWKKIRDSLQHRETLSWLSFIFVTLALFSISKTKLPHYLWPCFPFLALLMAETLGHQDRALAEKPIARGLAMGSLASLAGLSCFLSIDLNGTLNFLTGNSKAVADLLSKIPEWPTLTRLSFVGHFGLFAMTAALIATRSLRLPHLVMITSIHLLFLSIGLLKPVSTWNNSSYEWAFQEIALRDSRAATETSVCVVRRGPWSANFTRYAPLSFRGDCSLATADYSIGPLWHPSHGCDVSAGQVPWGRFGLLQVCKKVHP